MNVEELKNKLKLLFGEQIIFNKEFDSRASTLNSQENDFLELCIKMST